MASTHDAVLKVPVLGSFWACRYSSELTTRAMNTSTGLAWPGPADGCRNSGSQMLTSAALGERPRYLPYTVAITRRRNSSPSVKPCATWPRIAISCWVRALAYRLTSDWLALRPSTSVYTARTQFWSCAGLVVAEPTWRL